MKSLRKHLNLTQRELADLIGVSTSVVCMYEKGLRNLPSKATDKLVQLQLLLQETGRPKSALNHAVASRQQVQLLKVEKMLKAHARKAASDALHISQVLSRMQERYEQLLQKLNLVQHLLQQAPPATRERSLLENIEVQVLDAMDRCGPARQAVAAYKLAYLKARQQAALQAQVTNR